MARAEWPIEEGGKVIARRSQYPLRLAWAMSIHKSQGMTLPNVEVEVGGCFEYGQCYVTLSRAVSIEGLVVHGFDRTRIRVHPAVRAFHARTFEEEVVPLPAAVERPCHT